MLSVFSFCAFHVWFGVFGRFCAVLLFLESLFEKFFGSELLFLGVGVGLVFFGDFLPMFLFYFWQFAPETVWKNSLDVRSAFFGCVLSSFGFFAVVLIFKRHRSGCNRTPPTRTCFGLFLFSFCVPPRLFLPVLAVRPASCVFCGLPFWAPCVFGILLVLVLRPLFLGTRGSRGVPCFLCLVFSFPLLFCVAATRF